MTPMTPKERKRARSKYSGEGDNATRILHHVRNNRAINRAAGKK